jgi:hypothetical protein
MNFAVHLFADVDHIDPEDPPHAMASWFHKQVTLPFVPTKDMHLEMGFEETEEGEVPAASILSVNYNTEHTKLWCHVKVFARCDFRNSSLDDAVRWYEKHGWTPCEGPRG